MSDMLMQHRNVAVPLLAVLSAAAYVLAAEIAGDLGFPLDDSWIHQTLARNLSSVGQFSINPGQPAAVSTSPLWTLLLALGDALRLPNLAFAYLLGGLSLGWSAWLTLRLGRALFSSDNLTPWLAAVLVATEWHLVWASLSGMETLLFTAVSLAILDITLRNPSPNPLLWGGLAGLLVLLRPEGILLGGLVLAWRLWPSPEHDAEPRLQFRWTLAGLMFTVMIAVWLTLNVALSEQALPSTFVAKHEAYGFGPDVVGYGRFLLSAIIEMARGSLLLLYPGLFFVLIKGFPAMSRDVWLPLTWAGLLIAAFAFWLPAVYQHGRYLVPVLPLLLLYGLHGTRRLIAAIPSRLLPQVAVILLLLVTATSWVRGLQVFVENVGYINQQQIALARWIDENTARDAVVASHDIGALGYYGGRTLVDMAGLASPEITETPRDVARILSVLQDKRVTYVLIQPQWYAPLYEGLMRTPSARVTKTAPLTEYGEGFSFEIVEIGTR